MVTFITGKHLNPLTSVKKNNNCYWGFPYSIYICLWLMCDYVDKLSCFLQDVHCRQEHHVFEILGKPSKTNCFPRTRHSVTNHVYFLSIATDSGHCFFFFFPAIDGNYTSWSDWSECSATCGGGQQSRLRTCTSPPPKHGGRNCSELGSAVDSQICNPDPCRE